MAQGRPLARKSAGLGPGTRAGEKAIVRPSKRALGDGSGLPPVSPNMLAPEKLRDTALAALVTVAGAPGSAPAARAAAARTLLEWLGDIGRNQPAGGSAARTRAVGDLSLAEIEEELGASAPDPDPDPF